LVEQIRPVAGKSLPSVGEDVIEEGVLTDNAPFEFDGGVDHRVDFALQYFLRWMQQQLVQCALAVSVKKKVKQYDMGMWYP
jgi:hypothetical protein